MCMIFFYFPLFSFFMSSFFYSLLVLRLDLAVFLLAGEHGGVSMSRKLELELFMCVRSHSVDDRSSHAIRKLPWTSLRECWEKKSWTETLNLPRARAAALADGNFQIPLFAARFNPLILRRVKREVGELFLLWARSHLVNLVLMRDLGSMELLPRIENEHNRQQRAGSQEEEKKRSKEIVKANNFFTVGNFFSPLLPPAHFLKRKFRWEIAEFIISRFISREEIGTAWIVSFDVSFSAVEVSAALASVFYNLITDLIVKNVWNQ